MPALILPSRRLEPPSGPLQINEQHWAGQRGVYFYEAGYLAYFAQPNTARMNPAFVGNVTRVGIATVRAVGAATSGTLYSAPATNTAGPHTFTGWANRSGSRASQIGGIARSANRSVLKFTAGGTVQLAEPGIADLSSASVFPVGVPSFLGGTQFHASLRRVYINGVQDGESTATVASNTLLSLPYFDISFEIVAFRAFFLWAMSNEEMMRWYLEQRENPYAILKRNVRTVYFFPDAPAINVSQSESVAASDASTAEQSASVIQVAASVAAEIQVAALVASAGGSESAASTETQSAAKSASAAQTETAGASETQSSAISATQSQAETNAVIEASGANLSASVVQAETSVISEASSKSISAASSQAESNAVADTPNGSIGDIIASQAESASVSDGQTTTAAASSATMESSAVSDAPSSASAANTAVSESTVAAASETGSFSAVTFTSETTTVSDSHVATTTSAALQIETQVASDQSTGQGSTSGQQTETAVATDAAVGDTGAYTSQQEAIAAADAQAAGHSASSVQAESMLVEGSAQGAIDALLVYAMEFASVVDDQSGATSIAVDGAETAATSDNLLVSVHILTGQEDSAALDAQAHAAFLAYTEETVTAGDFCCGILVVCDFVAADLVTAILSNRQELDPIEGKYKLYAADGVTLLRWAYAWADAEGTQPYNGGCLKRLDAMQLP